MEFYGIECKGPLHLEKVSTLPTHTAADEGRVIYVEDENKTYVGNDTEWKLAGGVDNVNPSTTDATANEGIVTYYGNKLYYSDGTE